VVTRPQQIKRRTGKVRLPKTDVLPLCHATNRDSPLNGNAACVADLLPVYSAVTEMEIQQGLLSSLDASQHCLCFMRNITNLEEHISNRRAQKYIDTTRISGITLVCNYALLVISIDMK